MLSLSGFTGLTVAFISTQLKWKGETDILLKPSRENGLKKHSLIRLSKLATIDKEHALGRLGSLNLETLILINRNLKKILKLDEYKR